MRQKPALTLDDARRITAAAEAEAAKNGWNVCIAVVDDGAHLSHFIRMEGAQLASIDIALGKARSALLGKRPTKAYEDLIAGGRTAALSMPGITHLEGGVPIVVDGNYVGAVGVSGVKSAQDAQIAEAGIAAL
ncbi:MAG: heme-binding protein [Betaproteobacteria bacterium]|nr:heme-binding protein [Betaproteobacteria bacterium]